MAKTTVVSWIWRSLPIAAVVAFVTAAAIFTGYESFQTYQRHSDIVRLIREANSPLPPIVQPPKAEITNFIIEQVEHFYVEMFFGMSVLYALIAAIFGYIIPKYQTHLLDLKISEAKADIDKTTKQQEDTKRYMDVLTAQFADTLKEVKDVQRSVTDVSDILRQFVRSSVISYHEQEKRLSRYVNGLANHVDANFVQEEYEKIPSHKLLIEIVVRLCNALVCYAFAHQPERCHYVAETLLSKNGHLGRLSREGAEEVLIKAKFEPGFMSDKDTTDECRREVERVVEYLTSKAIQ